MNVVTSLVFLSCLLISTLLVGCEKTPKSTLMTFYAFGTVVHITLQDLPEAQETEIKRDIDAKLQAMHQRWHAWSEDGILSKIHQNCSTGNPVPIPKDIEHLISLGRQYETSSKGYFNPALGELIQVWGFLSSSPNIDRPPPSKEAINAVLALGASMQDLTLSENKVTCHNPGVMLDFGGFAKGQGIEELAEYLQQRGIQHALINAGGDLKSIGKKDRQSAWRVALENPITHAPIAVLESSDEGIFTSGTSRRRFQHKGKYYHHLLDPKTGYPAETFLSVTVVANDSALADAAATALLIAGPKSWQSIASSMGVDKVITIDKALHIEVSEALKDKVHVLPQPV